MEIGNENKNNDIKTNIYMKNVVKNLTYQLHESAIVPEQNKRN
jgi:hypothetical protein